MATNLNRTVSTSTSNNKFTISVWIKRSELSSGSYRAILTSRLSGSSSSVGLWFKKDSIAFLNETSSSGYNENVTTEVFRDVNAWYHIVIAGDTTQSGTDKLKFYVNGEQITSFSTDNRSSFVGLQYSFGHSGYDNYIGSKYDGSYQFYGIMSHYHFIDGTAYDASAFGSTDATTGEWKLNTAPNVTYGNNGFFILKDGNSITDQSGEGNNWTVANGTLTKTEDCPSNVFCTLNPLTSHDYTFTNGNNTIVRGSGQSTTMGTFAPSSGKWYWEVKLNSGQSNYPRIGVYKASNTDNHIHTTYLGNASGGTGKWWGSGGSGSGNNVIADGNSSTTAFYSYNNGDILMFAMDNDNGKLWFGKNGVWYTNDNSSTTTGTAIGNGTATPAFSTLTVGENWSPSVFGNDSADNWSCNFGNGYFGTTAVSSQGTNASNNGIFEYDVPPNFTAISTKGLNL